MIGENARAVLEKRYLIRDGEGKPTETVEQLFQRVAEAIAAPDRNYDKKADTKAVASRFYERMTSLEFLPNSPTLMNAGRPLGQLSACFVLPVADAMEDIFEAIKQAALIHKSGGGTGFSFSRLRPKGSTVNSTGGVASGPISFMKVFNTATEAVKQGGTRRGANMGILRVDHPDILEFIDCKQNTSEITNFNISVGLTEEFMNAVEENREYELRDPSGRMAPKALSARMVFDRIVDAAWRNGEPGIIFLDRLNRDNVVPGQGEIESTNPCGEQPLLPYESCNLGSVNLTKMLKETENGCEVDYDRLASVVRDAVHFLDNVIDANRYPLEKIEETTKLTRKIGLGVMGFADMLLLLGVPYNSPEGVELGERIMAFINEKAKEASAELAKKRGPFPLFGESTLKDGPPLRNATVTTIAPTGTLSIIAGCSSGVEPVFAYAFVRNVMDGTELIETNPILKEELTRRGLYSDELMKEIIETGHIGDVASLPADLRRVYVCSHEVSPEYHIRMQAAFQRHTDNAVSKTVNFSREATREEVAEVYELAFRLDCKGVTIYRDGSRDAQVLNIGKVNRAEENAASAPAKAEQPSPPEVPEESDCERCQQLELMRQQSHRLRARPRPEITTGFTEKVKIGCGNLYITVNYDDEGICEVFTNTGRHGGCPSQSEATSRLVSVSLRSGMDPEQIIEQLRGIRCAATIRQQGMKVTSCPDAIAKVIEKVLHYKNGNGKAPETFTPQPKPVPALEEPAPEDKGNRTCPECGAKVEHEGGCVICRHCGYSKCG